ncbi:unnamed protein product [Pleuronectes platessa]|uniref:Uncharacterized protein n=1 Tax=Pleuronectes platessa TaxID=8262 RepID=A0A9N7UF01_PLEPL|nr:unnamed protein product [Pleuronectes platessa]
MRAHLSTKTRSVKAVLFPSPALLPARRSVVLPNLLLGAFTDLDQMRENAAVRRRVRRPQIAAALRAVDGRSPCSSDSITTPPPNTQRSITGLLRATDNKTQFS